MQDITVILNGRECNAQSGASVQELLGEEYRNCKNPVVAVSVNNVLSSLTHIPADGDKLKTFNLKSSEGSRIFATSLSFVLIKAARDCMGARVHIKHSMGEGLYCEIDPPIKDPFDLDRLEEAMRDIIAKDLPFKTLNLTRGEAEDMLLERGQNKAANMVRFFGRQHAQLYSLEDLLGMFLGLMVPSTGYLSNFALHFHSPGFLLLLPKKANPEDELVYIHRPKLAHVFDESEMWAEILECGDSVDLNRMGENGTLPDFIRLNEALHEKTIAGIADKICSSGRRVVLVAGPSSSGKTTFTQRLLDQIKVNGKKPVMISLDNYYRDRDKMGMGDDGKVDLEDIKTLDLALFNEQLLQLLAGETVLIPRFNFKTGKREQVGVPLALHEDGIVMFEGIHGLNDMLTPGIARTDKFKIYISALTQLNIDRYNRIPTTDVRCIRRIVRDSQYRGTSAEKTLDMWPSVIAGERKWIFPFQEQCDVMFNSALVYELPFLKKYADPLLKQIGQESEHYIEAQRLLDFLNYFILPECEQEIPRISILREFIGGGCFEH